FAKALTVAHGLDEPVTATTLLAPFRVEMLTSRHAVALTRLVKRYGERWAEDLLQTWSGRAGQDRLAWLASLPRLCEALQARGSAGTSSAQLLVASSWRWLSEEIRRRRALGPPSARDEALDKLGPPLASVLEATSVIGRRRPSRRGRRVCPRGRRGADPVPAVGPARGRQASARAADGIGPERHRERLRRAAHSSPRAF